MKQLLIIASFIFCLSTVFSQTFIQRTTGITTPVDNRLKAAWNFYMPTLQDTTLLGGKDSLGCLIYVIPHATVYIRDTMTGGHKWTKLLKFGDVSTTFANNGLSKSGDTTQLGGTLNKNTTVNNGGFLFTMTGTNSNETFSLINSGTGRALLASSIDQNAIDVFSANASAISASSTNGVGISITSYNNLAAQFSIVPSSTNSVVDNLQLIRVTTGTPANGIGQGIVFYNQAITGGGQIANRLVSKFTDATFGSLKSSFEIWGTHNSTLSRKVEIKSTGQLTLDGYGTLPTSTDSTTYKPAAFDANGNLVKMANWLGGGSPNAITQLTGDVTAIGPGSVAATIAANAVSNAKFRQSVGVSVVGRSANTTGSVADIVSTLVGTVLKRSTSTIGWDSLDFADLKNAPTLSPTIPFSPAQALDPRFIVFASAIPRTNNVYSPGSDIVYIILDHTTDHNSSFYDSVYGGGSNQLVVRFPTVKSVLNTTITVDEALAANSVTVGSSTALNQFDAYVYRPVVVNCRLTGNGTTTWVKNNSNGLAGYFDLTTYNTSDGGTSFNIISGWLPEYDALNIQYIGPNNYHIKRVYSGLGSYNVRFILCDEFGNAVTSAPTTVDEIIISNAASGSKQLNMRTWGTDNQFLDGFANFWIFGAYECWMVASAVSTASIQVKWQPYPSATSYKIYRATSLYGTRTLVHSANDLLFTDSGLATGTLYWYFFVPVIGGVDTEITYFRTSTQLF